MSSTVDLIPADIALEAANARRHPGFYMAVQARGSITLRSTSLVEVLNKKKRKRQAAIQNYRCGLTEGELTVYKESPDNFEKILAAHAASGIISYVVDLRISLSDYTRLLSARDSIRQKLPIGDSLLKSLEFLERWSRLRVPAFFKTEGNPTMYKWIQNMKEQDLALRASPQWGPLCQLYEEWVVDEADKSNFYEPQHDSLDSLYFDSD
ncbi:hypothetical protein EAE96_010697 [Botrytis aclada]|nr:hypothetical protein EAE96_010697 [Botrytis aclada]